MQGSLSMPESAKRERAPAKEIFGWAMFDFANSAYTTVIITVVFAVIFPKILIGPDNPGAAVDKLTYTHGNWLWSVAQVSGYLLVVISAPIFGAIMDYSASKKRFLVASYALTVLTTAALYFVTPGQAWLGILLVALSLFGFLSGENFVSSFLIDLGPPEDLGRISGMAWGLGYFGGLASTVLVTTIVGDETVENIGMLRFVGPITAAFFMIAAIPTFLWVKERGSAQELPAGASYLTVGFTRLRQTISEVGKFRDLSVFLISVFFAMAGLIIVISFAFIYGDQVVKWSPGTKKIMFIVSQIAAAGGALLFGFVQDRLGAKKTFNITLVLWVVTITLIWGTNDCTAFLNGVLGTSMHPQYFFLFVGSLAGMGLGATQSASRAIVGIFSPESKSGEFFGFWGLSGKLAAIPGLVTLGYLQTLLGLQSAILICSGFFFIALLVNMAVNEKRGLQAAIEHEGE